MEYALIGEHLSHSVSPQLHAAFGRYSYELCELPPDALGAFLRARAFLGLNVTIPYKQAVLPYLDEVDPSAAEIGAVNTVVNRDGRLFGYNTDLGGLEALLLRAGIGLAGKKVLILGTGGTAKTARAAAKRQGARELVCVSRTAQPGSVTYAEALAAHTDAEVILNATPVGMAPEADAVPIALAPFSRLEGLVDVVYNPLRTRLVLQAQALGVPAVGGLYMLVRQAAASCALFTGATVDPAQAEAAFRALRAQRENLVLIGMPGSGKTTVGRLLAEKTGRPFYDADEEIARCTGRTPAELLLADGEARFRALEAEALRELSKKTGCVIATGGGAVLDPENVLRLKQNGRLYALDRPLHELLPSPDRPLSGDRIRLRRLYTERRAKYLSAADDVLRIEGGGAEDYAAAILASWENDQ